MVRKALYSATAALALLPLAPAQAWFHGFGGGFTRGGDFGGWSHSTTFGAGGVSHSSDWGGWDHSTQAGYGGVSHESGYGGAWHGTAATPYGAYHASDYGGYYHASAVGPYGAVHTTAYGGYYHQPYVGNYYGGSGCWNCGTGAWGAAAAGAAVGLAAGAAVGAAATAAAAPAYVVGTPYAVLPGGCGWQSAYGEYNCGGTWFLPRYGATASTTTAPTPALALECPSSQPLTRPGITKETPAQLQSLQRLLSTGDEDNRVRSIVDDLRARYPGVENAAIINYLVAAYCPVVSQLTGLGPQEQQARMDRFVGQVVRLVY